MNDALPAARSGFDRPATYRIRVRGRIPPKRRDHMNGMAITEWSAEGLPPMTTLLGELPDQVALASVLDALVGLHLSVLSVECLSTE